MAIQLTHSLEAPCFLQISFRKPRNSSNNCSLGIFYCPLQIYAVSFSTLLCAPGCFPVQISSQFVLCSGSLLSQPIGNTKNRMLGEERGKDQEGYSYSFLSEGHHGWVAPLITALSGGHLCTTPSVRVLGRLFPFTPSLPGSGKSPR